ncbi:MAG: CapA family protein [Oscillospiraceae bacterium]|jgi:poly-gamma-glutamate synthesis protein (capsule biosynthesis protein)|nr:CapA family protein [Oscillospiraceae bacterium]
MRGVLAACLAACCLLWPPGANAARLTLTFAGDCALGSDAELQQTPGEFVPLVKEKGLGWPFSSVADILAEDDLTLVNLECALTDATRALNKKFTFRGPAAFADILTLGSVEAVNLANNHTQDYGPDGYRDTLAALDVRGIAYSQNRAYTLVNAAGIKVALFGYLHPGRGKALLTFFKQFDEARAAGARLILVSYHWGVEYGQRHSFEQARIARETIDRGADAVIGTHPHVLQGMQLYKGKPILYSLGNFVYGGLSASQARDTALVRAVFDVDVEQGDAAARLAELRVIPCLISAKPLSEPQDYRPVPAEGEDAARVLAQLAAGAEGWPDDFFETGVYTAPQAALAILRDETPP